MSRRKQARPKSCKAEDQESDQNDVPIKEEAISDDDVTRHDVHKKEETDAASETTPERMKVDPSSDSLTEFVTSPPEHDVTPFVATGLTHDTDLIKENMRCQSCGVEFDSLAKFMDHSNSECCKGKNDLKSTNWLLQETSNLDSVSPSSQSTNGGLDEGVVEEGMECEGLRSDSLDPNDIPYVIGVTTDNPYGCIFCEKAFAFLSHLHRHEQTHTAQLPFKCAHCPRYFRHQKSCERHEKLHSADRKYRCKVCGVGYSRSDHLRNHMKNHDSTETKDMNNKCPFCSLPFSSPTTLANHMKKHKEDERESPDSLTKSCLECHQVFGSDQEMEQHVCSSLGEEELLPQQDNQMKCPICSELFSSMESLCHHLICHRTFNMEAGESTAVNRTSANVTSERSSAVFGLMEENVQENKGKPETQSNTSSANSSHPLVCPYCLIEGFESLESLELHLTSVHNVKPTEVYTCNYCNAPYPNLYSLHDHMTVVHRSQHGLDITYPCSMCVQRFHSLDALAKHKGIVHSQHHSTGIDAAFCNRCNMTLSSPRSLEDHMATVHNIIMEKRPTSSSKHTSKGKKSSGKHNQKVNITTSNKSNTTVVTQSTKTPTSPKKQRSSLFSHSVTTDDMSIKNSKPTISSSSSPLSSSTSSSITTSPSQQSVAPYTLNDPASKALRITSLLAKKAASLASSSDKSVESHDSSAGMTCDHCNATFYDIQNYSAHLLHHTGALFNTSASPATIATLGHQDKWSGFQQQALATQRESTLQNGTARRPSSRSSSASGDATETRNNSHECLKCKATFPSNDQLETHVLLHYLRVSTEYGCSSCAKNFSKPDELQRHLMDIHAHHLYRCSLCKEIFDSKVNIQVHFAIKHSDECKLYRCAACELNFLSEMEWQVHVRVNHLHISRPYRCLFCQESFTSEVELQCHLTTHSKPFVCPMCSQAFHIEYLLDQHMQQNHGDVKPNLTQQVSPKPNLPTPLSLLIPTTIKQEHDQDTDPDHDSNASPSMSPHFATTTSTASPVNRSSYKFNNNSNNNSSTSSNNHLAPSSSPLPTKTILKSPTASTLGKLSHNSSHLQVQSRSPVSANRGNRPFMGATPGATSGTSIPAVWKNSEPLHMCNICDIKFNDYNLLMIHKAQDHDLKSLGKASDKFRDEDDNGERINFDSIVANNEILLSTIANATHSADSHQNGGAGRATPSTHSHVISSSTPPSCMFCSQTFKNNVDYEKHMKIHVNSGNLTCSICDETFSSPSVLAEHKLMHCKIQQGNTCVACRITLCNKEQFYAHTQEHGFEGTQLQCVVCRQSLSSLVELQMHGRHHFQSQATFFTCCVCLKSFESRENLVSKLNSSGRTYYVCKPCYHGEAPPLHTCSQCSEKFATEQLLETHMLTHKSSFQCIKCQQSFSSEYEIQLHVATHLMTEGTQHECRLCGTSCDTPARLQTHLIQHSFSGMDITCFVCKKSFESPQEIQVHVLEHPSSYKKYSCAKCPQRFFFTAELENHKLTYNHVNDSSPVAILSSSTQSTSPSTSSSSSASNFHASALLASLSATPQISSSESSHSSAVQVSKLFSSPLFEKNSCSVKESSSTATKHQLSPLSLSSSLSSPTKSKVMKLDKSKRKGGVVGTLTIPTPNTLSSSLSTSSRRLECTECHKFFTTGTALANHRKTHLRKDANKSVKCSLCDEGFPSATAMQQHFFSTHSATGKKEEEAEEKKPMFECMMCEKACATLAALQNHILSHRTQSIASCSKLNNTKSDIRKEKDTKCEAKEKQQDDATVDKKDADEDDTGSEDTCLLACPVCNQVFLKAEDIDDHIKTHEELFIFEGNEQEGPPDKPEGDKTEDDAMEGESGE